jgi:ATP-dependent DNA ligase
VLLVHRTRLPRPVPDLRPAIAALGTPTFILEGELRCFDEKPVSCFHLLAEPDGLAVATPPVFMVFDCMHLRGRDLRPQPLSDHRRTPEDIIDGHELLYVARRLADDGLKAWAVVQERGYEGFRARPSLGEGDVM